MGALHTPIHSSLAVVTLLPLFLLQHLLHAVLLEAYPSLPISREEMRSDEMERERQERHVDDRCQCTMECRERVEVSEASKACICDRDLPQRRPQKSYFPSSRSLFASFIVERSMKAARASGSGREGEDQIVRITQLVSESSAHS